MNIVIKNLNILREKRQKKLERNKIHKIVFWGGNFPVGSFPGANLSGWQFSEKVIFPGSQISSGIFPWCIIPRT